LLWQKKR